MKTIKNITVLLLLSFPFIFVACDKDESEANCEITAKFQDMTGLDGCGFVLVLDLDDEERRLEPLNLADFDIEPVDGLEVCIEFEEEPAASICMVGETVRLISIE
ncbi:MAG: hypothetical protein AB8G22_28980 [Saprospiraceae bacterium]